MELSMLTEQARTALLELLGTAALEAGDLFVVGCSSSEVIGEKIGSHSSPEVARAVLDGILPVLRERGIFLAAQCCEHLNRALVIEEEAARLYRLERVNVLPQPKADNDWDASAAGGGTGPAVGAADRRGGADLCTDPSEVCRRSAGGL